MANDGCTPTVRQTHRQGTSLARVFGCISQSLYTESAMATSTKATAKPSSSKPGVTDAITLLIADHKEVKQLFKEYDKLVEAEAGDDDRELLAQLICAMLTVHATAEEEIFYPAARSVLDEEDLVDEATVEHASAKDLIAQLLQSSPDDSLYDAKVKVLGEYVDHHVKEEEGELFPKLRKSDLDLVALGEQLGARKEELTSETNEAGA
jgi:hemerythrin superfamily protein